MARALWPVLRSAPPFCPAHFSTHPLNASAGARAGARSLALLEMNRSLYSRDPSTASKACEGTSAEAQHTPTWQT
eukprot:38980-Pleurochrysis_carterae.AAC.1